MNFFIFTIRTPNHLSLLRGCRTPSRHADVAGDVLVGRQAGRQARRQAGRQAGRRAGRARPGKGKSVQAWPARQAGRQFSQLFQVLHSILARGLSRLEFLRFSCCRVSVVVWLGWITLTSLRATANPWLGQPTPRMIICINGLRPGCSSQSMYSTRQRLARCVIKSQIWRLLWLPHRRRTGMVVCARGQSMSLIKRRVTQTESWSRYAILPAGCV